MRLNTQYQKELLLKIEKQTKINIAGADKELVSKVSADIKSFKTS